MNIGLTDELLVALEQIVGGKVYSVYYDPIRRTYDVGFERDNRLQQEEVTVDRVEELLRNRELLMLHGARYAVLKLLDKGGVNYAKRLDGSLQMIKWTDICDYLTAKIDNYKAESEVEE